MHVEGVPAQSAHRHGRNQHGETTAGDLYLERGGWAERGVNSQPLDPLLHVVHRRRYPQPSVRKPPARNRGVCVCE